MRPVARAAVCIGREMETDLQRLREGRVPRGRPGRAAAWVLLAAIAALECCWPLLHGRAAPASAAARRMAAAPLPLLPAHTERNAEGHPRHPWREPAARGSKASRPARVVRLGERELASRR